MNKRKPSRRQKRKNLRDLEKNRDQTGLCAPDDVVEQTDIDDLFKNFMDYKPK